MGSQRESVSTASPTMIRNTSKYAQLIGPSFLRMQMLGFAGLPKQEFDLRFIDPTERESIPESIKAVISSVKADCTDNSLRFMSRDMKKCDGETGVVSTVNYGYQAGMQPLYCCPSCTMVMCSQAYTYCMYCIFTSLLYTRQLSAGVNGVVPHTWPPHEWLQQYVAAVYNDTTVSFIPLTASSWTHSLTTSDGREPRMRSATGWTTQTGTIFSPD